MAEKIVATVASRQIGFTITATVATLVGYSDMLVDLADFEVGAECRLVVVWKNTGTNTNNIKLYDQIAVADIAASTLTAVMGGADTYQINESALITVAGGLKSLMIKAWVSAGTATIDKIELHIVGELPPEPVPAELENKSANMGSKMVAAGLI